MKIDKTVRKETGYILIGQVALFAILAAVYFIIDRLTHQVLFGAVAASILAVGNFFLMGITIQKSLDSPEDDRVKIIRASQTIRLMGIALVVVLCLAIPKLDPIATLIPLFFPRITVIIRSIILNRTGK